MAQPQDNSVSLAYLTSDPFGDAPHLSGLEPKLKSNNAAVSATDPKELKALLDASKQVDLGHTPKLKLQPLRSARVCLYNLNCYKYSFE